MLPIDSGPARCPRRNASWNCHNETAILAIPRSPKCLRRRHAHDGRLLRAVASLRRLRLYARDLGDHDRSRGRSACRRGRRPINASASVDVDGSPSNSYPKFFQCLDICWLTNLMVLPSLRIRSEHGLSGKVDLMYRELCHCGRIDTHISLARRIFLPKIHFFALAA